MNQDRNGVVERDTRHPHDLRVLDGVDDNMLAEIRLARASARDRAWLARGS